jgi:hypothetical protein
MEIKRGRGRPKGSKGTPKIREAEQAVPDKANIIPVDVREIKKQIRMLRKIKKDTHKKTAERRELNEKIRTLKAKLIPATPEKSDMIQKILERRPEYTRLGINLEQYTLEQLKLHYDRILTKARLI